MTSNIDNGVPAIANEVILSCFNDSSSPRVIEPTSFKWAYILTNKFPSNQYSLVMLLHGTCLDYGLDNAAFGIKHGGLPNPWFGALSYLNSQGVKVKICELCLTEAGYNNSQLLSFVVPVPFSVHYLISQQLSQSSIVIYDA